MAAIHGREVPMHIQQTSYRQCFEILFGLVSHSFSIHFDTRPTNLTACVHYGEIPAHN
jgi:hypothetical protein